MLQKLIDSRQKAREESGFTLIELLVVIIILGILAAVVVFAVSGIGDNGQASACKIDTRTLRTAEEAFYATPVGPPGLKTTAPGSYAPDVATLKAQGFLTDTTKYHNVTTTRDPAWPAAVPVTPYYVTVADAGCGTVGHAVGQAAADI